MRPLDRLSEGEAPPPKLCETGLRLTRRKGTPMNYRIDPRKNWALAEQRLSAETDPRRRQILGTLIAHAKAEAKPDFDALLATVSPRAHYHAFASDDEAHSLKGKDGVAAYYKAIVDSGCGFIEHAQDRLVIDQNSLTSEGELKMAYPGTILEAMGIEVPSAKDFYIYEQRLLIVWDFDETGSCYAKTATTGVASSSTASPIARSHSIRSTP